MGWRKHRDGMDDTEDGNATLVEESEMQGNAAPDASIDEELLDPADLDPLELELERGASDDPAAEPGLTGGAHLGRFVTITGELRGDADIEIGGRVEGSISLRGHRLTVGPTGQLHGEVHAREVLVAGLVVGDITAAERVEVTATGSVQGEICAPRVVLADGARFRGKIDMGPVAHDFAESAVQDVPAPSLADDAAAITLFEDALPEDVRV